MADGYSEWVVDRQLVPGMFQAFVDQLEPELRGRADAQILDVASASGEPAASLAAALPLATVHATDLTPRFVQLGAARAQRLGLRNMRCQVADAERLEPFADASCDAVCCCMGLMFIPNVAAALAAFDRVLKPGGALVITVAQPPEVQPFWTFLSELSEEMCPAAGAAPAEAPYPAEFGPCRFGDPQPLLDAAAAAGLSSIACRPMLLDYQMAAGEWWTSLTQMPDAPVAAALQRLQASGSGANAAEQARQLAERRLRERGWLQPDGSVCCPGNGAWLITARKGSQ
ncbi:methyltransferase type 11 [Chlorella sorokiniana]|uniref:Methyltransferase type 11 n=1 Tax=Chlorella sorokiniana TaxID=3076 RepID=A0A2P6TIN7_CHLSO|nr:methyltransferase type 11 [Chlorella sorokiniana]|eukprot:PRW39090.1 methyltransferase type 11 [Chlorella sorokiniana]